MNGRAYMLGGWVLSAVLVFGSVLPTPAAAQTTPERDALLAQLAALQAQLVELQTLLAARVTTTADAYETVYFSDEVETIYTVRDGTLAPLDGGLVRTVDAALFALAKTTLGDDALDRYVDEFRVFADADSDIGAFVELKRDTDNAWILGINRDSYRPESALAERSFRELFVHEYAHILAYNDPEALEDFLAFWDRADRRHAAAAESLRGAARFDALQAYYEAHDDEFVSDYATLAPEEDLAETFVRYVFADAPSVGETLVDEKLRFLDRTDTFRDARAMIRAALER